MRDREEEGSSTHGIINIEEARLHTQALDWAIEVMVSKIEAGQVAEAIVDTINMFKDAVMKVMPGIADANKTRVLNMLKDPGCMAIHPYAEETERLLEELMPIEEIPSNENMIANINNLEPLSDDQKRWIGALFWWFGSHTWPLGMILQCIIYTVKIIKIKTTSLDWWSF